ncbi:methylglyoxal synthase [bacterium BMS3Bbin03]|nr:methylglyoxal synthase [bacterium BMS3Bbin03]
MKIPTFRKGDAFRGKIAANGQIMARECIAPQNNIDLYLNNSYHILIGYFNAFIDTYLFTIRSLDMNKRKNIALVAHDNRKRDLIEWVEWNYEVLLTHNLICTGTTGRMIEETLRKKLSEENVSTEINKIIKLKTGPLGGDQQLGAMITEGKIDILIFFWDPMEPHPHDVDVKALLRISVVYNIPIACNRSSADFIISSPLISEDYKLLLKDYSYYLNREIK